MSQDSSLAYADSHYDRALNDFTELDAHELLSLAGKTLYRFMLRPKRIMFFFRNMNSWQKWLYLFGSLKTHTSHILFHKFNIWKAKLSATRDNTTLKDHKS